MKRLIKITSIILIQVFILSAVSPCGFSRENKNGRFCLSPSLHVEANAVKEAFGFLYDNNRRNEGKEPGGRNFTFRHAVNSFKAEDQLEIASSRLIFESEFKKVKKGFNLKKSLFKNKDFYTLRRDGKLIFPAKYIWHDIGNLWVNWLGLIISEDFNVFWGYKENICRNQLIYIIRLEELIYGIRHNYVIIEPGRFKLDVKILTALLKLGLDYDWSRLNGLVEFNLEYGKIRAQNDSCCNPLICYEEVTEKCWRALEKFGMLFRNAGGILGNSEGLLKKEGNRVDFIADRMPISLKVTQSRGITIETRDNTQASVYKFTLPLIDKNKENWFDSEGVNLKIQDVVNMYALGTTKDKQTTWPYTVGKEDVPVKEILITQVGITFWRVLYFLVKPKSEFISWVNENPIMLFRLKGKYYCIAGNHRLLYYRMMNMEQIPCLTVTLKINDVFFRNEFERNLEGQVSRLNELFGYKNIDALLVDFWRKLKPFVNTPIGKQLSLEKTVLIEQAI